MGTRIGTMTRAVLGELRGTRARPGTWRKRPGAHETAQAECLGMYEADAEDEVVSQREGIVCPDATTGRHWRFEAMCRSIGT